MTRKQAAKLRVQHETHVPYTASLIKSSLYYYVFDSQYPNCPHWKDADDLCASILMSELATGADDILPELDQ